MSSKSHFAAGFVLLLSLVLLGGCKITAEKDSQGHDKNVDIRTPLGSISVHEGETDPNATGLTAYPGAQLRTDRHGEGGANVNVSSSLFGVKVAVLKYHSDDSPDKVLAFYRQDMAKYGKVLDCTGGFAMHYHRYDQDAEVTCDGHGGHEYQEELKVGTQNNQRVVAIRPSGGGSEFALIYVRAWDDKTSM